MLKKLMKHELRATSRMMLPALLFVLAAAVGGNISINRLLEADSAVFNTIGGFLIVVYTASVMAACILAFVLMIQRFYQNLLQDEGYLMLTLPVSVHAHILSKLLVSLIWWYAVAAAGLFSLFILVFNLDLFREVWTILSNLHFHDLTFEANPLHIVFYLLELWLMLTAGLAYISLLLYASMAAGHSFSRHKGILSVVIAFFVLNFALHALQYGAALLVNLAGLDGLLRLFAGFAPPVQNHLGLLGVTGLILIPCAAFYALTAYCLKNRLNLG